MDLCAVYIRYVIGGYGDDGDDLGFDGEISYLSSMDIFTPPSRGGGPTGRWRRGTPMPMARARPGVVVINDEIWIVGGRGVNNDIGSAEALTTVDIYDHRQKTWRAGPPMVTPRDAAGVIFRNGEIWAVGG